MLPNISAMPVSHYIVTMKNPPPVMWPFVKILLQLVLLCYRMDVDDDDEMDGDGGFEAELALLDEVEADIRSVGEGPEAVSTSTRWSRPPVPSFDLATDALVFQQFDVDFHTGVKT